MITIEIFSIQSITTAKEDVSSQLKMDEWDGHQIQQEPAMLYV